MNSQQTTKEAPLPIYKEGIPVWYIEKLVDRKYDKKLQDYYYQVKWEGYPMEQCTWEPKKLLIQDAPKLIENYDISFIQQKKIEKNKKKVPIKPEIKPPIKPELKPFKKQETQETKPKQLIFKTKTIKKQILKSSQYTENNDLKPPTQEEFMKVFEAAQKILNDQKECYGNFENDIPEIISTHCHLLEDEESSEKYHPISKAFYKVKWKERLNKETPKSVYYSYETMVKNCADLLLAYLKDKGLIKTT